MRGLNRLALVLRKVTGRLTSCATSGLAGGWRIAYVRDVTERWRDVAHVGHAELLTPTPEASLEYFTTLLGPTVVLSWRL
jgi:hypothetical protein